MLSCTRCGLGRPTWSAFSLRMSRSFLHSSRRRSCATIVSSFSFTCACVRASARACECALRLRLSIQFPTIQLRLPHQSDLRTICVSPRAHSRPRPPPPPFAASADRGSALGSALRASALCESGAAAVRRRRGGGAGVGGGTCDLRSRPIVSFVRCSSEIFSCGAQPAGRVSGAESRGRCGPSPGDDVGRVPGPMWAEARGRCGPMRWAECPGPM